MRRNQPGPDIYHSNGNPNQHTSVWGQYLRGWMEPPVGWCRPARWRVRRLTEPPKKKRLFFLIAIEMGQRCPLPPHLELKLKPCLFLCWHLFWIILSVILISVCPSVHPPFCPVACLSLENLLWQIQMLVSCSKRSLEQPPDMHKSLRLDSESELGEFWEACYSREKVFKLWVVTPTGGCVLECMGFGKFGNSASFHLFTEKAVKMVKDIATKRNSKSNAQWIWSVSGRACLCRSSWLLWSLGSKHMACAGCRACNAREHCQIVNYELQGLQCAYEASHSCSNMMASLPKTKTFSTF